MKKNIKIFFIIVVVTFFNCVFLVNYSSTEEIFSDDFSKWDDFESGLKDIFDPPDGLGENGWAHLRGGPFQTFNGITHYSCEVKSPGRKGPKDKAFRQWRHGNFTYFYHGMLCYSSKKLFKKREIYIRYYMQIPSDFRLAEGRCNMGGLKLRRIKVSNMPSCFSTKKEKGTQFLLHLAVGRSFTSGKMTIRNPYIKGSVVTLLNNQTLMDIRDSRWHCHELRIKLNDEKQSNGEIQYWLDGKMTAYEKGLNLGADNDMFFSCVGLGIGNTHARDCERSGKSRKDCIDCEFQQEWRAIAFDDYVVSTEYIGPDMSETKKIINKIENKTDFIPPKRLRVID
jgi:hypothetical protein